MKVHIKHLSILFALILVLSFALQPVSAAQMVYSGDDSNSRYGNLESFMTLATNRTINFDSESAVKAGIDKDIITAVRSQIDYMNHMVLTQDAYIDDTFTLTVYFPSTRARGESKVVTHWYGLTEVYLNSTEAEELIDSFSAVGDATSISGLVGMLPGPIASAIGNISGILSFSTMIYRKQIEAAAEPGNGIIMYVQNNFEYGTQSIWFTSQ